MRGHAIKQGVRACLLGLTLLAGCNHIHGGQDTVSPYAGKPQANGPIYPAYRRAAGGPYACCNWRSAALLTGTSPTPAPQADLEATTPPAAAPTPVAEEVAMTPPLQIASGAQGGPGCDCAPPTASAPCQACSPPPSAAVNQPCQACQGCPAPVYEPAPVAALAFKPAEEPQRLPRIDMLEPATGIGDVLSVPAPSVRRRSFVDLTAAPCFGHAPDYRWVSGQVEHSCVRKEWRLRYASVDETDRYGGRVVLVENEHVGYLSDGQYVRVEGHLVNPDDAVGTPGYYRVEAFRIIDSPNRAAPVAHVAAPRETDRPHRPAARLEAPRPIDKTNAILLPASFETFLLIDQPLGTPPVGN